MKILVIVIKISLFYMFFLTSVYSEIINKILIKGNERISNKTILMFSNVELEDEISNIKINSILKDLYETDFFEDVKVSFDKNTLTISVKEYPIIQNVNYTGIKSKSLLEEINSDKLIREKSPYNITTLEYEKNRLSKK